jgi:hypothetical protein
MFLAILKMMESSRAAVVTPTTSSNEWLKHVGISYYLPYRACAILGIPGRGEARRGEAKRSEGGSSMFRHYTWIFILPSATGIGIGPDKN